MREGYVYLPAAPGTQGLVWAADMGADDGLGFLSRLDVVAWALHPGAEPWDATAEPIFAQTLGENCVAGVIQANGSVVTQDCIYDNEAVFLADMHKAARKYADEHRKPS